MLFLALKLVSSLVNFEAEPAECFGEERERLYGLGARYVDSFVEWKCIDLINGTLFWAYFK